jgi:hypothetical protein
MTIREILSVAFLLVKLVVLKVVTRVLKIEIKSTTLLTIAETIHMKEEKLLQQKGVTVDFMNVLYFVVRPPPWVYL